MSFKSEVKGRGPEK